MFFTNRYFYIYSRVFRGLSLEGREYFKKYAKFKNFKIKDGYYKLMSNIAVLPEKPKIFIGWGKIRWGIDKWGT